VLRTVSDQPTLWDAILPSELLVLPAELGRVDALLDDPVFFAPFAAHFDARIGRPSIPMETYLRLMFLKFWYRLGYEVLCREVADSISWQRFCRIPLGVRVPHPTTLMKISTRCGDDGVAALNEALKEELTAINQYWLHYRLLDNWGYRDLAKKWRKESIEEMEHADKIVERIIFLDGFPNMQVLDPLHIGQNVREVLDCDLAAEMSARALYQEAATHCHSVKDYVTRDLFEKLMHDEEQHIDFLETQLDLVAKLGLELYAQHHIGKIDDDHS